MFNAIACAYDLLAANPERERREGPFLARWAGTDTQVLDLACGTGVHAALLAETGRCRITAVDLSPAMLARAERARAHAAITWQVGDMRCPPAGPFDRAMILGNALNVLPNRAAVAATLQAVRLVLRPGGRLVVQIVNPQHPRHREPRLTVKRGDIDGTNLTIIKSLVPQDAVTLLSLSVFASLASGRVESAGEQVVLLDLQGEELIRLVDQAGFTQVSLQGGFEPQPFEANHSLDVLAEAQA